MNGVLFVQRIKEQLKIKGINQTMMLKDLGLPKNSVTNWEQRGNIPSGDIVYKISCYLGVTMQYLLTGKDTFGGDYSRPGTSKDDLVKRILTPPPEPTEEELEKKADDLFIDTYLHLSKTSKHLLQCLAEALFDTVG